MIKRLLNSLRPKSCREGEKLKKKKKRKAIAKCEALKAQMWKQCCCVEFI